MTDVIQQRRTLTCDRCGTRTNPPPDSSYPSDWRKVSMAHPDTGEVVNYDLHPDCARAWQEQFMGNLDCPPFVPV